jgi:hypothetical protein
MTTRQLESIVKYTYDLSKGILLAAVIGLGTGKLSLGYFILNLLSAVVSLLVALRLEGRLPDANE